MCIDAGQWKAPKPRIRRFQRHPQSKKQLNPKAGCLRLQSMICKAGVKGGKSCLTPFRRSVDPMSLATELPLQPLRSNRAGNLGEHASENCETEGAVTRWTTLCGSVCCFHTCPRSTETPAVSPIRREAIPARNRRWSAALAATSPRRNDRLDRAFEQILRRAAVLHLPATQAKGAFTIGQWKRDDADRVCRECGQRYAEAGAPWQCISAKSGTPKSIFRRSITDRSAPFIASA